MKTENLCIRITPEEKALLQKIADMCHRTLSQEVMYLIEKALGNSLRSLIVWDKWNQKIEIKTDEIKPARKL